MGFRPARLSYNDLRRIAEEFLAEFHEERTIPVPIEEIVEFDFRLEVIPNQLHRPLYEGSRIRSVRDWEKLQNKITEDAYAWFEFQANSFAGLVLVPSAELRGRFDAGIAVARKAGMTEATLWSEAGKAYLANWLADQFDASKDVIERRLDKDGLWALPDTPS